MPPAAPKLRNIGPRSAAWLRQVGLRTQAEIAAVGAVEAYVRVRRAGFRPSLNLLYGLEGMLCDCHWQEIPEPRRQQLLHETETAIAQLPAPRHRPEAAPVTVLGPTEDAATPGLADDESEHAAHDD